MFARRNRGFAGQRAQMIPIIAGGAIAMVGMLALTVDVGYWRYQQRLEQSAADSAAVAGAIQQSYTPTGSSGTPTTVARANATLNGFTDDGGVGNVSVGVITAPPAPPRPGATAYPAGSAVEVDIREKQPNFFASIFGGGPAYVSARAVAVAQPDLNGCIYQIDPTNSLNENAGGPHYIDAVNCSIIANGSIQANVGPDTQKVSYHEGSAPTSTAIYNPDLVADPCFKIAGCAWLKARESQFITPPPGITPADASKLSGDVTYASVPSTARNTTTDGTAPAVPQVYLNCPCGNLNFKGPAVFYLYGGSTIGDLSTDQATVVNVNNSLYTSGGGPHLTSTTPGQPYATAGMAWYQPYSNTQGLEVRGAGGGSGIFQGTFYAPSATFTSRGGGLCFGLLIVAGTVTKGGGKPGGSAGCGTSYSGLIVNPAYAGLPTYSYPTHVAIDQ